MEKQLKEKMIHSVMPPKVTIAYHMMPPKVTNCLSSFFIDASKGDNLQIYLWSDDKFDDMMKEFCDI